MKKFFSKFWFICDFFFSLFGFAYFLGASIFYFFLAEESLGYIIVHIGFICGFVCCGSCLIDHIRFLRKSSGKKSVDNK